MVRQKSNTCVNMSIVPTLPEHLSFRTSPTFSSETNPSGVSLKRPGFTGTKAHTFRKNSGRLQRQEEQIWWMLNHIICKRRKKKKKLWKLHWRRQCWDKGVTQSVEDWLPCSRVFQCVTVRLHLCETVCLSVCVCVRMCASPTLNPNQAATNNSWFGKETHRLPVTLRDSDFVFSSEFPSDPRMLVVQS